MDNRKQAAKRIILVAILLSVAVTTVGCSSRPLVSISSETMAFVVAMDFASEVYPEIPLPDSPYDATILYLGTPNGNGTWIVEYAVELVWADIEGVERPEDWEKYTHINMSISIDVNNWRMVDINGQERFGNVTIGTSPNQKSSGKG